MISQTRVIKLVTTIFPITGTLILLTSVIKTFRSYHFVNKGLRIEGEIIEISTGKQPTIKFLPTGRINLVEFSSSGIVNYKVGDQLTVLFLRDSNPYFMVDTPGSLLFEPVLFAAMGIVHLKVGLGLRTILR